MLQLSKVWTAVLAAAPLTLALPSPLDEAVRNLENARLAASLEERADPTPTSVFYNNKTTPWYVPGNKILNVPFNAGESYAGLMPVNTSVPVAQQQQMFYWFWPTANPAGTDDIVIWLNGGPGCSSMEGLLQENGPISWRPGVGAPVPNRFSWHKLAHAVWVEYPIGTGFSSGPVTANNNDDAAQQFISFWKNLLDTFDGLKGKRIYITGESYAGVHVPYIGAAMIDKNDTTYYNVSGALYYDPVMPKADALGLDHAVMPALHRYWENVFSLPQKYKDLIEQDSINCHLDEYLNKYLTFPPPAAPWPNVQIDGCDVVADFDSIVAEINACYNPYHFLDTCPIQWDILGYPNPVYLPLGYKIWLNEPSVQKRLHVDQLNHTWAECQGPVYAGSGSDNYDGDEHEKKLQTLIQKTNNVIVGSARADNVIQSNKTALAIQMLTWNGKQGFQTAPSDKLVLPNIVNDGSNIAHWTGGLEQGTAHTERGLTLTEIYLAGHMVPQYTPGVALRHLEFLLGRVPSLSSGQDFTIGLGNSFTWPFH